MNNDHKVWLITGASSGLGKALAEAAIANGDRVVVTARRLDRLQALAKGQEERVLPLAMDVTDAAARDKAVADTLARFGRIDVLANLAGRGVAGACEEFSLEQLREQMELNFFAAAELSREVLPQMRAQRSGHILNLTSIAGLVAFPGSGLYNATKFALEGFTEALHHEVKPLGIHVTLIEPGAFRTGFASSAAMKAEREIAAYAPLDAGMVEYYRTQNGKQMGDPVKGARVIVDMVARATPPVRLMLGKDAYQLWDSAVASRSRDLAPWRERGEDTAFPGAAMNPVQAL